MKLLSGITTSPGFPEAMKLNTSLLGQIPAQPKNLEAMKASQKMLGQITAQPKYLEAMKASQKMLGQIPAQPKYLEAMKASQKMLGQITAQPKHLEAMKASQKMLGQITAQPKHLEAVRAYQKALGEITGRRRFPDATRLLDEITWQPRHAEAIRANHRALRDITRRPGFLEAMKLNTNVLDGITARAEFASMIALSTMPRVEWTRVVGDMRGAVGAGLIEVATAEFETAAEYSAQTEGEEWWFARLPMHAQFGLLLMALQVIDKAGEFLGDLTGHDVPQAYRTGVEMLFSLAFALHAALALQATIYGADASG